MKKLVVAIVLCLVLTVVMVSPVMAKSDNANGAVKIDLKQCHEVVGSAVINTTGNGNINVEVKIKEVPDICAKVMVLCKKRCGMEFITCGRISTNAQGNGNVHLQGEIPCRCKHGETMNVKVIIDPRCGPNIYGMACGVPLK